MTVLTEANGQSWLPLLILLGGFKQGLLLVGSSSRRLTMNRTVSPGSPPLSPSLVLGLRVHHHVWCFT